MRRIVVGTDGSDRATAALRWAIEEAELHGADVEAVLAWSLLDQHHLDRAGPFDPEYGADAARSTLAAWISDAVGPGTKVAQRAVNDVPVRALLEAGDFADLLVLGARGTGGFEGLLLGSVSERVAQLSNRPVAIVRTVAPVRAGRVVVGVDGSARAIDALRWAAAEARIRDAQLEVVHTWRTPMLATSAFVGPAITDLEIFEEDGRATLEHAMADSALTGVRATPYLGMGSAARALLERSADASLLVVGTRGRGRVTSALLGSVSRQVLHHAPCPVITI